MDNFPPISGHISRSQVKLVRSLHMKKVRDENRLFVAEGDKCIEELKKSFRLVAYINQDNATPTEIEQMSSLRHPQGSIAVFAQRADEMDSFCPDNEDLIVVLDGLQDPGNLGTIIRSCDWFGVHHLVCSEDTADCYNEKVVQATMGALARVHVHYTNLNDWIGSHSWAVIGTLLGGKNMYQADLQSLPHPRLLVMGNEGNGISPELRERITHPVRIPSYPEGEETSESLNVAVATAISLSYLRFYP